jgi:hypothetical protein
MSLVGLPDNDVNLASYARALGFPGRQFLRVEIEPFGRAGRCYWNADDYVAKHGGSVVHGWQLRGWPNLFVELHHHAAAPVADPRVRIVFSERSELRYGDFRRYMERLRADPQGYGTNAAWAHLDPDLIEQLEHQNDDARLLAADYLASAIGLALERKDQGVFDDRFARLWARKFYRYGGRVMGNGLKIWPEGGLDFLWDEARGDWLKMSLNWRRRA